MAIKKTVFEICPSCGNKQARQDEDGTVHFSHSCKQGAPGPPNYPRTFRPGEVIFMPEKDMEEIARQAMQIDDELIMALKNLLADVLNLGSFSITCRPSVEAARAVITKFEVT